MINVRASLLVAEQQPPTLVADPAFELMAIAGLCIRVLCLVFSVQLHTNRLVHSERVDLSQ
jgi:hypothetical protein